MSRLSRKHLARVNQQLSGQPREAPNGRAQPKGVGMWHFPLSLLKTQLPWSVNQALGLPHIVQPMLAKTFLQVTAGVCILFSALMGCCREMGKKGEPTPLPQGCEDL